MQEYYNIEIVGRSVSGVILVDAVTVRLEIKLKAAFDMNQKSAKVKCPNPLAFTSKITGTRFAAG